MSIHAPETLATDPSTPQRKTINGSFDRAKVLGDGIDLARRSPTVRDRLNRFSRAYSNLHRPGNQPDIFLFSLPRSGSTWLMELVRGQPGFKFCNEPLDLRNPQVRRYLGISSWDGLYGDAATPVLEAYFNDFHRGRLRFMNPSPFGDYYRPFTDRIVYKMIHGCEDRINWFHESLNGQIVYLVRHPIAVSLSREMYPTLPALLNSDYRNNFTPEQLAVAQSIVETGSKLEIGVLSWCLQSLVPLRQVTDDWTVISYEQLVQEPEAVIRHLCERLALPAPQRMLAQLNDPSYVAFKSDKETQRGLETKDQSQRSWLIEKWRRRVSDDDERRAMEILAHFDLDLYRYGEILPAERLWI